MKVGKSLYSIYKGINEAALRTNAKKTGFNYMCDNTPENREVLREYTFPKYYNKMCDIIIF